MLFFLLLTEMSNMSQKKRLKKFIDLLNEYLDFNFNIDNFNHRLKLQKYVFIGKFFGFKHSYVYNLYIRGPYSSELANDYYDVCYDKINSNDQIEVNIVSLAALVKNKDIDWLESASTMLSLYNSHKELYNKKNNFDHERLITGTSQIKQKIDITLIKTVFSDLKDHNLFN